MRETGGMNPSPASSQKVCGKFVGGGVPDAPRRGQDPSLRGKRYMGGNGKVEGRACPAPTDCCEWVANERGKGGRQPAPLHWTEIAREWAATQSPSESPRPLTQPAPFDKGASLSPLRGVGGTPELRNRAEGAGVKREQ